MKKHSELLKLARESIKAELENKELAVSEDIKKRYSKKQACFVTLIEHNELRGCIGSIKPSQELWKDVIENARNAAFHDSRFPPISKEELEKIKIEISILSIPKKISYKSLEDLKKKIKNKGIVIKKGWNSATYLPQVWEELPDADIFLSSLCRKALLSSDAWKNIKSKLEIWVYKTKKIKEK